MKIQSKVKDYSCEVISDIFTKKDELFKGAPHRKAFYFVDAQVGRLYKKKLQDLIGEDFRLDMEADERHKSYDKLGDYYEALIKGGFTRRDVLITIGGGILQDISGFIASTLYRGIKWIYLPTTLLAQADSCIGSKTSINFRDSKNLIGTFYPPDKVFIDLAFTKSLTPQYFNSGMGEIIKFHLLSDKEKYSRLEEFLREKNIRTSSNFSDIVRATLEIKASYFTQDEFDTGRRNLLNYGHCYGHALESATDFSVNHGEAVIVGMGIANRLAVKRGYMTPDVYDSIEYVLRRHYPIFNFQAVSVDNVIDYMKRDKKRVTKDLTMIMLTSVGEAGKWDDVTEQEVRSVMEDLAADYPQVQQAQESMHV